MAPEPAADHRLPGEAADQTPEADIGQGGHGVASVPVRVLTRQVLRAEIEKISEVGIRTILL